MSNICTHCEKGKYVIWGYSKCAHCMGLHNCCGQWDEGSTDCTHQDIWSLT